LFIKMEQRTTAEKIENRCPEYTDCRHYHPGMGDGLNTKCYGDYKSCEYFPVQQQEQRK